MDDTFTERPETYRTPIQQYGWEYLMDYMEFARNTTRNEFQTVRRMFRYVKRDLWGIPEDEFVHMKRASVDDPVFTAEEICGMTKREIADALKEHEWGAINAERCIEYEKNHQNRDKILERFRSKQRRDPEIDWIDVTEDDIRELHIGHIYKFLKWSKNDRECKISNVLTYLRYIKRFTEWASTSNDDFPELAEFDELQHWGGIRDHDINYGPIKKKVKRWKKKANRGNNGAGKSLGYGETQRLLRKNTHPKARAVLMLGVKAGLRREDYPQIKMKHVHLDDKYVVIPKRKKGHTDVKVLIDDECKKHLQRYITMKRHNDPDDYLFTHGRNRQYKKVSIGNYIERLADNTGFPDVTAHWLRHTFANHYMQDVAGTEKGDRELMKLQKSHKLDKSENYSAAKHRDRISLEQRRRDYEKAVPKYRV